MALAVVAYRPPELDNTFPEDYSYVYGEDRPFAPSLARTDTGGAFDARSLAGSESCGTSGCHEQIVEEWSTSAHRYSAMDVGFQKVQDVMAEQNGAESTRYCGGCHDPISLFSGTKNIFVDEPDRPARLPGGRLLPGLPRDPRDRRPGQRQLRHHPARALPVRAGRQDNAGNAGAGLPDPHLSRAARPASRKRTFKTPEYCAACHKQFIDQEVNQVGWVQLQNQYDNWRKSRWNHPGDPAQDHRVPRVPHAAGRTRTDPAAGDALDYNRTPDDGKHRSHRFIAANQMMPALLELPGAEEHIATDRAVAAGRVRDPRDRGQVGAPARSSPLELEVPEAVAPGDDVPVKAVVTSNKVGPRLPDRSAGHHPDLGRAGGHRRRRATWSTSRARVDDEELHRAGLLPVQGRARGPARQPHRPPQPLGDGGRALPALAVPRLLGHGRVHLRLPGLARR